MVEFILMLICVLYPVVILIYYGILFIEWLVVRKRIWQPGRMTVYRIIFIQALLPFAGFLLYYILPGSTDYWPGMEVCDRHINTLASLLLLFMVGGILFLYTCYREKKKYRINIAISDKARRKDLRNHKKRMLEKANN